MLVSRPVYLHEPDLLQGHEEDDLCVYSLDGNLLMRQAAPVTGWTHEKLDGLDQVLINQFPDGWDAWLGGQWVGSSEV